MQITGNFNTTAASQPYKSGNSFPEAKTKNTPIAEKPTSMRDLAKSIDPTNMSRNDAKAIAVVLGKTGDLELNNAFLLHSMILVTDGGSLRTAVETDSIMNEKFNMFDALESNIAFNKSKGLSTEHLEKGLEFLEKFQTLRESPDVDLYA